MGNRLNFKKSKNRSGAWDADTLKDDVFFVYEQLTMDIKAINEKFKDKVDQKDFNFLSELAGNKPCKKDIDESINALSSKLDKAIDAIRALGDKIDADATAQNAAVTNSQLDVDYRTTIEDSLL